MKNLNISLGFLGLLAVSTPTLAAGTSTGSLPVSATFTTQCTVVAGTGLSFGTTIPSPVNANIDPSINITANCSSGTDYKIGLGMGSYTPADGCAGDRRMIASGGSSSTVRYGLYTDATRLNSWGNGDTACPNISTGKGNGLAQPIPVYARLFAGQTPATGNYADTVQVTISW